MRLKKFQGMVRRLTLALILVLGLVPISSNPVIALSVEDFFLISYRVEFSKTEIQGNEVFYATVTGEATCIQELPINRAWFSSGVIAESQTGGTRVTLNPSYTITIDPFPGRRGDVTQASQVVPLQFPTGSQSGTYNIIGELIEAKVEVRVLGWLSATAYLPKSRAMGSVTYASETAQPRQLPRTKAPGVTDLSNLVDENGVFIENIITGSVDGLCKLSIDKYVRGLTKDEEPLKEISILTIAQPPPPPADTKIIGSVYDLGPEGATFEPHTTLTITYDKSLIPSGVDEKKLVLAMWDKNTSKWVVLKDCKVDTITHIVSAPVNHFTNFTILAYIRPAAFTATNLTISPAEVNIGENVTISATVANTGDLAGSHKASLKIDDVATDSKMVTLAGGATQRVTFTTAKDIAGSYRVNVNGSSGTFTVRPAPVLSTPPTSPPPAPSPPAPPAPPTLPTPLTPPQPAPAPPAPLVKPINWWLIGGIIAGYAIVAMIILRVARR